MIIAQEAGQSGLPSLLFFVVLIGGMYLLLIRPQRVRARQMAQVRSSLEVGATVMTTAGLIAPVAEIAEDDTVLLEIAPGVRARFAAQAIVRTMDEPGRQDPGDADDARPGIPPQDPA